jgi:NADH dehydrogenase [ubiquinone] 1 alpha subcomplex assembly factor 7
MQEERLDAFMARANAAYYAHHDPFADFVTAPELSQAFGEVLGAWAAQTWLQMNQPTPVILAEAGPGRGTLMADALRLIRRVLPPFADAIHLVLVETSPRLRALQTDRLPGASFVDRIQDLPSGPLVLIANEFLDALPIRQFHQADTGWTERFVAEGHPVDIPSDPPPGPATELCPAAQDIVAHLAHRLATHQGAALFLDYGPSASTPGDSLQALRAGRPADPYTDPGEADLTAHVDFAALARAAPVHGAAFHGPIPQGPFLARIGLFQRTDALARTAGPQQAAALIEAAQRLAEPDRMGHLFKALCLTSPALPIPAGFEE